MALSNDATDILDNISDAFQQSCENIIKRRGGGGRRAKLKLLRNLLNLTQREFAELYDLPFSTVKNWEQPDRGEPTGAGAVLLDLIFEDPEEIRRLIKKSKDRQQRLVNTT